MAPDLSVFIRGQVDFFVLREQVLRAHQAPGDVDAVGTLHLAGFHENFPILSLSFLIFGAIIKKV